MVRVRVKVTISLRNPANDFLGYAFGKWPSLSHHLLGYGLSSRLSRLPLVQKY